MECNVASLHVALLVRRGAKRQLRVPPLRPRLVRASVEMTDYVGRTGDEQLHSNRNGCSSEDRGNATGLGRPCWDGSLFYWLSQGCAALHRIYLLTFPPGTAFSGFHPTAIFRAGFSNAPSCAQGADGMTVLLYRMFAEGRIESGHVWNCGVCGAQEGGPCHR